jgi:hypothetical protein
MEKYLAVPFSIKNVYEGFAELDGLLRIDQENLILEYQTKDAIFGVVKSAVKNIYIKYSDILSMEFKKGFFSSKITITTSSFIADKMFPKAHGNELELVIKKKHKEQAMQLVSIVNLGNAESRLFEAENS